MSGVNDGEQFLAKEQENEVTEGVTRIPVVRGPRFVRLAPNSFTAWHIPGGNGETRFSIYLQAVESRETAHYLDHAPNGTARIAKKSVILETEELAAISLTLIQMQGLKAAIDGALDIWEMHEKQQKDV